jgi:hypothetical protein
LAAGLVRGLGGFIKVKELIIFVTACKRSGLLNLFVGALYSITKIWLFLIAYIAFNSAMNGSAAVIFDDVGREEFFAVEGGEMIDEGGEMINGVDVFVVEKTEGFTYGSAAR